MARVAAVKAESELVEVEWQVLRAQARVRPHGAKWPPRNAGYRRYLKTPRGPHFEIDEERIEDDARCHGSAGLASRGF